MRQLTVILFILLATACSETTAAKTKIKDGVYKDNAGNLYFQVINLKYFSGEKTRKYLYLDKVYLDSDWIPLNKVVDIKTVKKVRRYGMYFIAGFNSQVQRLLKLE